MDKECKRMRWWPRPWEYREAEAWLEDMAAKGWALESLGFVFAKFMKTEPAARRYRCVLYDSIEDQDSLVKSYEDIGWKCHGFNKSQKVFSPKTDASEIPDPTDVIRQEKLARQRVRAKIILVILSVIIFVVGVFGITADTANFLNKTVQREITYTLIFLWFVNYWLLSAVELLGRVRSDKMKGHPTSGRFRGALSAINIIMLVILLVPGPICLVQRNLEKRVVESAFLVSDLVEKSDSPFSVEEYDNGIAIEGYGVFTLYQRVEFGSAEVYEQGFNTADSEPVYYSVSRYQALFPSGALALGERLHRYQRFFDTYIEDDEPLLPMPDNRGFDKLWAWDSKKIEHHLVLAVSGCDVYYMNIYGPLSSDQLIRYLQQEAGIAS